MVWTTQPTPNMSQIFKCQKLQVISKQGAQAVALSCAQTVVKAHEAWCP
jgi:hypothetical protein